MEKQKFDVAETFGVTVKPGTFATGFKEAHEFTPDVDDKYVFNAGLLGIVLGWWEDSKSKDGLFVTGPTGSGKTTFLQQIMARLNVPLIEINAHEHMELSDMLGHYVAIGGDTLFEDGPLLAAARNGWPVLINEFDLLPPGTSTGLNSIFDGHGPIVVSENGGELVYPAPGFRKMATGNTAGTGDTTGIYAGTERQNASTGDRFWFVEMDYPPEDVEVEILTRISQIPDRIAKPMVDVANKLRKAFTEGGEMVLDLPFSTRALVRWAQITKQFHVHAFQEGVNFQKPLLRAMEITFSNRLEPSAKRAVTSLVEAHIGSLSQ